MLAGGGGIQLKEAVKNNRLVSGCDTNTGICNSQAYSCGVFILRGNSEIHRDAAIVCKFNCIIDQVNEHLTYPRCVPQNRVGNFFPYAQVELQSLGLRS